MKKLNENAYYLIDVSFTKGKVLSENKQGLTVTAERSIFNMVEVEFPTMREAKKYAELNGLSLAVENKLAKYTVTTIGRMMIEKGKRFGIKLNETFKVEVNKEKRGWVVMNGFDMVLYFGETNDFTK